ncbi:MAG: DUF2062 domain-containing protein [Phycisphaerales bacterium]
MFITRKIGKFFRGKATPLQIMLAAALGAMVGFTPGFMPAPGLNLTLIALLIVLNANLLVAGAVGLLALAVAIPLAPITFAIGRFFLDGPTQPLFKSLINAPVFAWFGFDYYLVTGGMFLGLLFGLVVGYLLIRALATFRRKMASLEEGSDRYKRFAGKWWARVLTFVFIGGGHGKAKYADLMKKRFGNPIRPLGVVFVALVAGLLYIGSIWFSEPVVTALTKTQLERANGATVDLESADLDIGGASFIMVNLAMADPNALETNILETKRVEMNVDTRDLLRKRITVERAQLTDAASGSTRKTPGRIIGPPFDPPPSQEEEPTLPGEKTIEDYIEQAEEWKERLEQVRRWLEKISESREPADDSIPPDEREKETLEERLKREIRTLGYSRVRASHLVDEAPTLLVRELLVEGLRAEQLNGEIVDVTGRNLSTHPDLVAEAPEIEVRTRDTDTMRFYAMFAEAAGVSGSNVLEARYAGLPVDRAMAALRLPDGATPLQGGTMTLEIDGEFQTRNGGWVEFPLMVQLANTTLVMPGGDTAPLDALEVPIGLRGPFSSPRIAFDDDTFSNALVEAGKAQLAQRFDEEVGAKVDEVKDEIGKKIGDEVGEEANKLLEGVFGGDKDDKKKKKKKDQP